MISRKMYKILKEIPHSPNKTTLKELREKLKIDINEMWDILEDAMSCHYIAHTSHSPYNNIQQHPFCLTEAGQIELEEYRRTSGASTKSTWALIIAVLSLLVSVVAIFF